LPDPIFAFIHSYIVIMYQAGHILSWL
jgi:hypothetical protein